MPLVGAKYEYHGDMFTIKELADMSGINPETIRRRLKRGMSADHAIDDDKQIREDMVQMRLHNLAESNKRRTAKKEAYTNASGYNDPTAGEAIMNNMAEYMNEPEEDVNPRKIGDRTVEINDIWYSRKGGKQYFVRECFDKYCIVYDVIDPEFVSKDIFPFVDLNLRENNVGIFYTRPSFVWYSNLSKYRFTLTESCVSEQDWTLLHHATKIRYRKKIADLQREINELKKTNETLTQTLLFDEPNADKQRIEELELANGSLADELIKAKEECRILREKLATKVPVSNEAEIVDRTWEKACRCMVETYLKTFMDN